MSTALPVASGSHISGPQKGRDLLSMGEAMELAWFDISHG